MTEYIDKAALLDALAAYPLPTDQAQLVIRDLPVVEFDRAAHEALARRVADQAATILSLRRANDELQAALAGARRERGDAIAEIARLTAEWAHTRTMHEKTEECLARANSEKNTISAERDDVAARLKQLLAEHSQLFARAEKAEAERDAALAGARKAHDALWELNPNNYDHDEVCKLNDGAIEAILTLAPLIGETHGYSPEWWNQRAALQPDPDARQADLAKAFCMGRDAAAETPAHHAEYARKRLGAATHPQHASDWSIIVSRCDMISEAIRALTPPADLAAKIGGE